MTKNVPAPANSAGWWRTVLGEYPTGVAVITSLDAHGQPIGMVVGSFSAVSESPPLISFMPTSNSTTYPAIASNGRFVVNVLGADHQDLCRAFTRKSPERFAEDQWTRSRGGLPRLGDALAWFEASITAEHPVGDHVIVVAEVDDFGVGGSDAGLPLLYLRGGYGSFTIPSLQFDVQGFARQLALVDIIRPAVLDFAERQDLECVICGRAGDSIVVLGAVNLRGGFDRATQGVGSRFPFAAPVAPTFVAWGTPEIETTWLENARHRFGSIDRPVLQSLLTRTRERGFGIWRGSALTDEVERVEAEQSVRRSESPTLWAAVERTNSDIDFPDDTTSVQLPVFDGNGTVDIVLVISKFERTLDEMGAAEFRRRLLSLRDELSSAITAG